MRGGREAACRGGRGKKIIRYERTSWVRDNATPNVPRLAPSHRTLYGGFSIPGCSVCVTRGPLDPQSEVKLSNFRVTTLTFKTFLLQLVYKNEEGNCERHLRRHCAASRLPDSCTRFWPVLATAWAASAGVLQRSCSTFSVGEDGCLVCTRFCSCCESKNTLFFLHVNNNLLINLVYNLAS